MKVVIDLDLHEPIQDFAVKSPAGIYEFKSQDTINWLFYFVRNGIVQDLTSGLAIKFGMIATGDTSNTLLAYQTSFTYTTDSAGNICYECPVNFNTSQMASAITGKSSLPCTAEVRYQTADELVHTLNISTLVFPTILVETGVTPPGVSTGYPDASAIELLVHKDQPSGYAGLNGSAKLFGAQIPVDGQTVVIDSNSNIASGSVLAYTTANFTTPAVNGSVAVPFVSTANLHAGQYVRIPVAGYYSVITVTDSTHATIKNIGDPLNPVSGVTIASGAPLLPAQAVSGGGAAGQNAFTTLSAGFTVPAVGATIAITVGSTAWMAGSGYALFISGAGYYLINSITDSTHAVVTNSGSAANATTGTSVASGGTISPAGPQGATGASGQSLAAYDTVAASFTMPNAGASVNITLTNTTAWMGVNQVVYIAGAGYFGVASIINATLASVTNLNYPGNAAAASTISAGARIGPGGLQGAAGAGGAGLNAFTTLTSNFTQPAVNSTVTAVVGTSAWMAVGQGIFVQGGGYYAVSSIPDLTHVTVTNLGSSGNLAPGSTVTGSGTQTVSPAGTPGTVGVNAFTTTTATFTTPPGGSSVTVNVISTAWASVGQVLFIAGAGYYQVAAVISPLQFSLTNLGANYGNTSGGTTIGVAATVSAAGVIGPAGAPGPTGAAGRDGAYSTVYSTDSIQGNGGASSMLQLIADIAQGTGPYKVYQRDSSGNNKWDVALLSAADAISAPGTGEVSLVQAQTNGVLSLKKLKSGAAGSVVLTNQGGSTGDILVDVPVDGTTIAVSGGVLTAIGGGGGGGPVFPSARAYEYDDFEGVPSVTGAGWIGKLQWASNAAGTGTVAADITGSTATGKGLGVWKFNVGATNDRYLIYLSTGITGAGMIPVGLGQCDIEFRVWLSALPSGSDDLMVDFGLAANYASVSGAFGGDTIGFIYWFGNTYTNWSVNTSKAGTHTITSTGVAVTAGTWWKMHLSMNAGWTSVIPTINGTAYAAVSTNVPTNNLTPYFRVMKPGGTTAIPVYLDYYYRDYQYTR